MCVRAYELPVFVVDVRVFRACARGERLLGVINIIIIIIPSGPGALRSGGLSAFSPSGLSELCLGGLSAFFPSGHGALCPGCLSH
jgi:hypothetical protein